VSDFISISGLYEVPILDKSGNPLIIDGNPITAEVWRDRFASYVDANSDTEREARD
jgi:hypothetical protein